MYLCSWNDSIFHAFVDVASLMRHLDQIEIQFAELQRHKHVSRKLSPMEREKQERLRTLEGRLGGMSTTIAALSKQLSGEKHIARSTLVMAEADGRDHLKDMAKRRAGLIRERVKLADEITALSHRPPRYAAYVAAVHALEEEGS